MKRLILLVGSVLLAAQSVAQGPPGGGGSYPAIPDFINTVRDYTGNYVSSDSGWYDHPTENYGSFHPAIEYDYYDPNLPHPPVVGTTYQRGSTIYLRLRYENMTGNLVKGDFVPVGARLVDMPTKWGTLPSTVNLGLSVAAPTNFYLQPGQWKDFLLTITGVPNYVSLGKLQLNFRIPIYNPFAPYQQIAENGTGSFQHFFWIFLVDDSPKRMQQKPWIDLLAVACTWAAGSVGETSVMSNLTDGAHAEAGLYNGSNIRYWITDNPFSATGHLFELELFIADRALGDHPFLQCSDYAGIMSICGESLGISNAPRVVKPNSTYWEPEQPGDPPIPAHIERTHWMRTNKMVQARMSTPHFPGGFYYTADFVFHQVVKVSGNSYDPTMVFQYDPWGNSNVQPCKAIPELTYIQTYSPPTTTFGVIDFLNPVVAGDPLIFDAHPYIDFTSVFVTELN
ncbi:MAG: hypothetical protein ABL949_14460 [Fimbriimonadaceae bacterium]